ncbi:MAG: xanthine dehydrogenase family protein molybdopterin-binding subunit [Acetobacteraceae bacterium]|nr:xanthine dehydrogenase family protein molybdopterin-binding subunit [Acetobacteraceae bacterium]
MSAIGQNLLRREDARFLTGQGRYLDDIVFPGALHARFVRSPHAHARIVGIDPAAARAMPGVVCVADGHDFAGWAAPLRMAPPIEGLLPVTVETMPTTKVRFDGDLVACVVAQTSRIAEDAAERVMVDYDALPPVMDAETAIGPNAPRVDDALDTNLVSQQRFTAGDPASHFATAFRIIESRFVQHRQTHAPMEPRGCCAVWDEGRQHLTMHVGNQAPHPLRTALASRLGLSESQVTVICPDIGGAFGQKIALYREELAVAALARALKRTVRWREERGENLIAAAHAREQTAWTRAAVTEDGRVLAIELRLLEDFGAYCFYPANYMARVVGMVLTGPYRIADYSFDIGVALTNKCGAGPMRAPMAITSWIMDGTLDAVARTLDRDPVEIRRRNMIAAPDLPYSLPTGEILRDVTPRETLEAALSAFDLPGFRARQAADRARGLHRGFGLCCVVEPTTYGSAFYKAAGIQGSGHEAAWVKVSPSGTVDASVGLMGSGQGYETALAQAVAGGLGVGADAVRMVMGNTDTAPYGMGSRGARGGTAGGSVLFLAAQTVQRKACEIAASLLGLNSGDELRLSGGRFERMLDGEWRACGPTLADIARVAYLDPLRLPPGMEPGLEAHRAYDPPAMTYSNATHISEVVVDVETGSVTPVRHLVAEDCGTVLNPAIVRGQQHGAVALGLAGALREAVIYDAGGQNLTGSFMDYALAGAADLPDIEVIACHTASRQTPTGSKGMSEGGVMGAIGAVTAAVNDALEPFGVHADRQPLTSDRLWTLLAQAGPTQPGL